MRRVTAGVITWLLLAGVAVPIATATSPVALAANGAVPKVVVIVGPSGGATDRYRSEARAAANLARQYTPDVTEVYSPNATWPVVKRALEGASLVIYMGHGNGWPSPYRNELYPPTQNGFGLNPSADGNDYTHQYFGEARIRSGVSLARNAVVLLNHLCYASGNSEPGVAEGTLAMAKQRVDNFAAGFIDAGASAVIAEAYASPNNMVRAVLGGSRSIEAAWRTAPSANGHLLAFESNRSDGYIAQMDPERRTSGFSRSIVLKSGLAPDDVLANVRGSRLGGGALPGDLVPSLLDTGIRVKTPVLKGATLAGGTAKYKFLYKVPGEGLPEALGASVRWDALDPVPADPTNATNSTETTTGEAGSDATADADSTAADPEGTGPASEPTAEPSPAATVEEEPPSLDLVVPERLGDVVAPVPVKIVDTAMAFETTLPEVPGRYRLTVTLHDAEGVAYDGATQALLPALIVRVTGDLDAELVAPRRTELTAGDTTSLELWIANLGREAWGHGRIAVGRDRAAEATRAQVVATWVGLGTGTDASTASAAPADLPIALKPGKLVKADLEVAAPTIPGDYLLVLDVVTPDDGSIVANGVEPTVVRVHVVNPEPADPVIRKPS